MRKKKLLTLLFMLAFLLVLVPEAINNNAQPPAGYTNAPGESTCAAAGCHSGNPITNNTVFRISFAANPPRPAAYDTAVTYNLFVNNSAGTPMYGFQVTAVDANGFPAGNFTLTTPSSTSLTTGSNGRQYVGHNNANSTAAWVFRWKPTAYVGPVTFYVSGLGANGNTTETGDQTYLDTMIVFGQGQPANINADFSINNTTVCVGDAVTFTNTSTGTITGYNWNFGAGATPATATTVGPHSVTYNSTGTKTITLTASDGAVSDTETKTVTVVSAPTANAGAPQTICEGSSATLTASGGTTYAWSNGAGNTATVTVSPTITTTYTVTVTTGTCSATDDVTVTVNPRPTADAGPNDTVCLGQLSTLTASGGVSYLWNTTQTTATISAVLPTAGSFTGIVTVTDANGCTAVDSAVAVALALPVVSVADVSTCGTGSATLDAGAGFASYIWSNSDATQTTTVTTSGSYSVTVTDANGCQNADTATATILTSLAVSLDDTTFCPGGSVVLDAGYPGATYLWSDNSTNQTLTVTAAGAYSVTVTDGSCTGADTSIVTEAVLPPVGAGADATICAGDVANLGDVDSVGVVLVQTQNFNGCALPTGWTANILTGNANWLFTVPNYSTTGGMNGSCMAHFNDDDAGNGQVNRIELLSPSIDASSYSILLLNLDLLYRHLSATAGRFSIEVWDGAAYQSLANYTSTQGGNNWANAVNRTFDLSAYTNAALHVRFLYDDGGEWAWWVGIDNFIMAGVPNNIYSWSPTTGIADPTSPITTARPLTTTTYILTGSVGGCATTDTVTITVNPSPVTTLSGIGTSYCVNQTTDYPLTGTPAGGTFSGPGVTGSNFRPSNAGVGTHNVIYSYFDAGLGCTGRDTIVVTVEPIPNITFLTIGSYYCIDEPAFALQATPAGGAFIGPGVSGGQFNPTAAGAGAHVVTYQYTSPAGCSNSATITYNVVDFEPSITAFGTNFCVSDNTPVALSATPAGGSFSGPGVSGNDFNPSLAGPGLHNITYTYDSLLGYTVDTTLAYGLISPTGPTIPYNFIDDDDELSNALPIGFNFNFFGVDYSQFKISTNGFLTFDIATTASAPTNQTLPSATAPNNLLAFMWDDLEFTEVDYFVTGTAPNRALVINFDAFHYFSSRVVIAQVVLRETTNEIEVHCTNCQPDDFGASATQGIENATGTTAFVVPGRNNTGWGATGTSVRFIPAMCAFTTTEQINVSGVTVDISDTTICGGESVVITATGSSSYAWSHGPTTASVTVSPTDTTVYVVTGTDGACVTTDTSIVYVLLGVNATITGVTDTVCSGDAVVTLTGSPAGGVFSGPGVTGTIFDPLQANLNANNTITYAVTNAFGCADTAEYVVYVPQSPVAQFTLADSAFCLSALPVNLTATPSGGTFSGPGISNGIFVPYFAGVGIHQLVYRVSVPGGCDALDTISVEVYDLPTVTFDLVAPVYCVQSDSVQLVGSPVGGTFTGPGVSADYFNPTTAGVGGPYILTYTFVDSNGCGANNVQITEVVSNPILQWVGLRSSYCENGAAVNLQALPTGGTFSGTGVTGNTFEPATAGVGTHTISYTYTDNAGCDATLEATVTVTGVLPIGIDNLDSVYCVNEPYVLLSAFPAGGVFSGNGVVGNVFSPDTAGTGGPYTVTYTYTDVNGCVTSTSTDVRIKSATNLLLSGLDSSYCIEDNIEVPITLAPTGGTLTGSGIAGNSFNPSLAGFGNYIIAYEYTNTVGCTSYASFTVNVSACTGINEVDAQVLVGLYPNPTTGLLGFNIEGLDGKNVNATVYSLHGQRLLVKKFEQVSASQALELDLSVFAEGTYMVQMQSGNYSSVHRVVISR